MSEQHYQILKSAFPLDNISNSDNCWKKLFLLGNLILYYFKNSYNLQEILPINDLERWAKYLLTLFKNIINKHEI